MGPLWKFFMKISEDAATCLLCKKIYSRKGRSTTNLRSHLRSIHSVEYNEVLDMEKEQAVKKEEAKVTQTSMSIPYKDLRKLVAGKVDAGSHGDGKVTSEPSENSIGDDKVQEKQGSYKLQHYNHLNLVIESLAGDEAFMDVTLTAEGKVIKAHKSVLSAVSPYFRSVLTENPCRHPIIIMPRDVRFEELNNIISYSYKGEITVAAEELSSLLKTAEILQVTGFTSYESDGSMGSLIGHIPVRGIHSLSTRSVNKPAKQSNPPQPQSPDPDENQASPDDHSRTNPLDFLSTDMTCDKEENVSYKDEAYDVSCSSPNTGTEPSPLYEGAPKSPTHKSYVGPPQSPTHPSYAGPSQSPTYKIYEGPSQSPTHTSYVEPPQSPNHTSYVGSPQSPTQKSYEEPPNIGYQDHSLSTSNGAGKLRKLLSSSRRCDDPTGKLFNPGEHDDHHSVTSGEWYSSAESFTQSSHVCPYCMETHRPNDALQTHLRLKHPSKPFFVCACGKVFIRHTSYTEHMKTCEVVCNFRGSYYM